MILFGAYLCGSIPTGVVLGRLAGVDVRASGSGNVGATNVARTAGARWGLLTLIIDVAKGAIPVLVARWLGSGATVEALVVLAAFFGHIFSLFSGLRGGKGVATAAGAFVVLAPGITAVALAVFLVVALTSRLVSLASLLAGIALTLGAMLTAQPTATQWAAVVIAASLAFTHRDNIRRLLRGAEPRFRSHREAQTH